MSRIEKLASICLFRTVLLSFVRVFWRPALAEGSPFVPKGPCFLYGNHSNRWDPFVLNCFTPWARPTAGVMTREHFRKPFLRWALKSLDLHPTHKGIAEPSLIRAIHALLSRNEAIVIYPEGGSRWAGRPQKWIESTAKVFARSEYPVYPVLMRGSYTTWPRWATYPRPGRIEIEILPPVSVDRAAPIQDTLRHLQQPISGDENLVEERLRPRWAFRPADGIEKLLYRDPITGVYGGLGSDDGRTVKNSDGSLQLRMLPDSRLVDERTGEVHTTDALYKSIREIPLTPNREGFLLQNTVDLSTEAKFPDIVDHGVVQAGLTSDSIVLLGNEGRRVIPVETLRAVDIERNFKLQLTLPGQMVQLAFTRGGSALAWQDALVHVLNGASTRSFDFPIEVE